MILLVLKTIILPLAFCKAEPTVKEAKAFLDGAENQLLDVMTEYNKANWVKLTNITSDTEYLSARASERLSQLSMRLAKKATEYSSISLPFDMARKIQILKVSTLLPTPSNEKESRELTAVASEMEGQYGRGKYCPDSKCLDLEQLTEIMAHSRNPKELLDVWKGWHSVGKEIRPNFTRYVELANKGARELGFKDLGDMWRARYDMPAEAFSEELDRLWEQVKPLYVSLHAFVRKRLREIYGEKIVPKEGPIPAHLLGNMWAQGWENIYPIVAPQNANRGYDLTELLKQKNLQPLDMVKTGEGFFESLGFASLPKSFWERSMFLRPQGREVVCHAMADNLDFNDDLRIKMCILVNADDFITIHHELGHNFYQRAYNKQPFLFRDSANDGFHEAIGDTIALSVTPEYLVKVKLLKSAPDASKDIGLLLANALEKIAFLPFGIVIDKWRWQVFSGEITPDKFNEKWWSLRLKYQGVQPPIKRSSSDFDPGAKYHVPANVPYMRYFLAHILQYQFHRSMSKIAGCKLPLHRCSTFGNRSAGKKLIKMLEMGQSRPWPDALEALTGQRQMDATAIRDYFAPLQKWLDEQNKGQPIGW